MADMKVLKNEDLEKVCGGKGQPDYSGRERRRPEEKKSYRGEGQPCPNCGRALYHRYTLDSCPFCGYQFKKIPTDE